MTVEDALSGVTSIFVDSAAVIYLIEDHPVYAQTIQRVFSVWMMDY